VDRKNVLRFENDEDSALRLGRHDSVLSSYLLSFTGTIETFVAV